MWSGDVDLAEEIMSPEFTLCCAQAGTEAFDDARTPRQLATLIAVRHQSRVGLRFAAEGTAVVDLALVDGAPPGPVARPCGASFAGEDGRTIARSGSDSLRVTSGLMSEVWSLSSGAGGRTLYHRVAPWISCGSG